MRLKQKRFLFLVLSLLLLTGCSTSKHSYIFPIQNGNQVSQGSLLEGSFAYSLLDNDYFIITVESWEFGEKTDSTILTVLDDSNSEISIIANYNLDKTEIVWTVNDAYLQVPANDISNSMVAWSSMTAEEFESNYNKSSYNYNNGIVLMCIGYNNGASIEPMSCSDIIENDSFLERYDFAQLIFAQLIQL